MKTVGEVSRWHRLRVASAWLLSLPLVMSCGQGGLNIIEKEDLGGDWSCVTPESCTADYLAFPDKAKDYAQPISDKDLQAELDAISNKQVAVLTDPPAPDKLAGELEDNLNIHFLHDGIDSRPLVVTTVGKSETDYLERVLLFNDPYVGTLKGILLLPKGAGPFPALVAIHGHGDSAEIYRDNFHGNEWPGRGYAILMLTMRAMNIDADEHQVTEQLLHQGFNLIGLRSYESLLGLKYLRSLPQINHTRIGLIGHSGGSSTGNLTVRYEPKFKAYVSDWTVDYYKSGFLELDHCETAPKVYPFNKLINDFSTSRTPILAVPYGYTDGMDGIFAFFDQALR